MIWLVSPNIPIFLGHRVHTHAGLWSLAQPPAPHLQLGHASSTTLKKPTQYLHYRGKLRHGHHHPAILQGKQVRMVCHPVEWNEITGETIMPPCYGSQGGFWDSPHSECPLEGRGPVSGDNGVLTWTCHCSDNLMHRPQSSSSR